MSADIGPTWLTHVDTGDVGTGCGTGRTPETDPTDVTVVGDATGKTVPEAPTVPLLRIPTGPGVLECIIGDTSVPVMSTDTFMWV